MCWSFGRSKWAGTQSGGWWKNWCLTVEANVNKRKVLKTLIWQKKIKEVWHHYMNSRCQTRTMEKKSQLKTIKVCLFQLVWFHLVALLFRIGDGSDDKELVNHAQQLEVTPRRRSNIGNSSTPMRPCRGQSDGMSRPCHLWAPPSVWDQWRSRRKSPDQTGGVTARGCQPNLECTILACWQIWWTFLSRRRAKMDFSPSPYEVSKPFLMDYLLLHLHLLYSVSLFFLPILFYKCVFYCFSFWFPLVLYHFLFFCISVLVWFGLRLLCVWSHGFSVSKLSLSPPPVLSFDLMVFVFLLRVYCY